MGVLFFVTMLFFFRAAQSNESMVNIDRMIDQSTLLKIFMGVLFSS